MISLWTTFTPQKVSWELTTVLTQGRGGTSNWQKQLPLLERSLQLLKKSGISGIRLVIYPEELTEDGRKFTWTPIETMLDLCKKTKLQVDLCIGPFQYPNYPGIYLPKPLLRYVFNNGRTIDTTNVIREFGERFLKEQMARYGKDRRIRGFHFANEWPDMQRVQGKEAVRIGISAAFMLQAAGFLKRNTDKPICMNTNIDASDKRKIASAFGEVLTGLEDQAHLGFDIYPSQETWKKAFFQKLRRLFEPYPKSFQWSCKKFPLCEMYFCEVEAQPWGNGQSWYRIISNAPHKEDRVLLYGRESLRETYQKYIKPSRPYEASLWGSDFWLSAHEMGLTWPLEQVKLLAKA